MVLRRTTHRSLKIAAAEREETLGEFAGELLADLAEKAPPHIEATPWSTAESRQRITVKGLPEQTWGRLTAIKDQHGVTWDALLVKALGGEA